MTTIRGRICLRLRFLLFFMAATALAALPGRAEPLFPVPLFESGSRAAAIVAADFNGDGQMDLATVDTGGGFISVLLGTGHGALAREVHYHTYFILRSLATADLNGDGVLDLVGGGSSVFVVLPGRGDGTFGPSATYNAGSNLASLALADLDENGAPDLVAASKGGIFCSGCPDIPGEVELFLGSGDGRFGPPARLTAGEHPATVAVADIDGDGHVDLAVGNSASNDVSVFPGRGDGSFGTETRLPAGVAPVSVALDDLDGDGTIDLAVATQGAYPGYASEAILFRGNGDGTFGSPARLEIGGPVVDLAVGDFNADGRKDLALAARENGALPVPSEISILYGNADGSFGPRARFIAVSGIADAAAADFDGDGRLDVAMCGTAGDLFGPNTGLLLDPGGSAAGARADFRAGRARSSVSGDFDGDGKADLAVASYGGVICGPSGCTETPDEVWVLLGAGDGTFGTETRYVAGAGPTSIARGDVDNDGRDDLVVANEATNDLSILPGNGDGTFGTELRVPAGAGPFSVALGDLNGDGAIDLAVADRGYPGAPGGLSILLGRGDGGFIEGPVLQAGTTTVSVVIGDFNRDGRQDLAAANPDLFEVSAYLGAGDGTFQAPNLFGGGGTSMTLGDFNADGAQDLAGIGYGYDTVLVNFGRGDGTFAPSGNLHLGTMLSARGSPDAPASTATSLPASTGGSSIVAGDLDGDGTDDLSAVNPVGGRATVFLGKANGQFVRRGPFLAGDGSYSVTLAGFDSDGRPDLALPLASGGGSVLLNSGAADADLDLVPDLRDNCPDIPNRDQADADHDGAGDACDNCRTADNPDQADADHDGLGNACDNCDFRINQDQADGDGDGVGDLCDNCVADPNPGQEDCDFDGIGDACDPFSCGPPPGEEKVVDIFISFSSQYGKGSGTVTWRTTVETDLLGFNVVEQDQQGRRVQLNAVLIPCEQCITGGSGSYAFIVPKHRSGRNIFIEMLRQNRPIQVYGPAIKQ